MSYIGNEPIVSATRTVTEITATAGQTVFTANGGYTVGYIDVFVNGAQLQSADFTATDGSTVVLTQAAQVGDNVRLVAWGVFNATNIPSGSLTAGGITWSQSGGVTLPRIDSSNEGGQLNFNRASDNTATWSIDSFGNTSTPTLRFIDGANVRAVIDGSGNVGIGTSSVNTANKLEVTGDINTTWSSGANRFIGMRFGDGSLYEMGLRIKETPELQVFAKHASGAPITFFTGVTPSERMRITSGGDLFVGSTTALNATPERLLVRKDQAGISFVVQNDAGISAQTIRSKMASGANNTSSYHFVGTTGALGVDVIYIYGNGNIVNSNGSYGTLSDAKLKENITDATPKLDDVMRLQVRNFNLKSDPEHKQIGFVAQELEQVFPKMIDESPDFDSDGNNLGTVSKSIKTSVLVPILVKAIQELKTIVDNQKIELDNAKAEIELLKGAN